MRGILFVALIASCSDAQVATLVPPDGFDTTLVVKGGRVRTGDPIRFDDDGEPVTVLFYARSLEAMALEVGANDDLVLASDAEDSWPLPATERAARYDPASRAFVAVDDLVTLAAETAALRVPSAPCGKLERLGAARINPPTTNVLTMASIGATSMLTSVFPPRLIRVDDDGSRDLSLGFMTEPDASILVFDDGPTFLVVYLSSSATKTLRLATDGTITPLTSAPASPVRVDTTAHWPGDPSIYGRDTVGRTVMRLDPARGQWRVLQSFPMTDEAGCGNLATYQLFALDGAESGVVGFAHSPPFRFMDRSVGLPRPIVSGLDLPPPCQSAYGAFPSGAELVLYAIGANALGGIDLRMAWRESPNDPWKDDGFPADLYGITTRKKWVLGIDDQADDVALLTHSTLRPEQAPRICAHLGLAEVRLMAFDGEEGFVAIQDDPTTPMAVAHFRVRDE